MGVRSDAVLVMKKEVYKELQEIKAEWSEELLRLASETVQGEEQVLLDFKYLKVYYNTKGNEFYDFVNHFDKNDFYLYILLTEGAVDYGVDTDSVGELEPEWGIDFIFEANIIY